MRERPVPAVVPASYEITVLRQAGAQGARRVGLDPVEFWPRLHPDRRAIPWGGAKLGGRAL